MTITSVFDRSESERLKAAVCELSGSLLSLSGIRTPLRAGPSWMFEYERHTCAADNAVATGNPEKV